jgi:hypothetical protein
MRKKNKAAQGQPTSPWLPTSLLDNDGNIKKKVNGK